MGEELEDGSGKEEYGAEVGAGVAEMAWVAEVGAGALKSELEVGVDADAVAVVAWVAASAALRRACRFLLLQPVGLGRQDYTRYAYHSIEIETASLVPRDHMAECERKKMWHKGPTLTQYALLAHRRFETTKIINNDKMVLHEKTKRINQFRHHNHNPTC